MPVKKDKDGRRFIEAEVEVPGSPEEVWRMIATGKGVSSWFVPSTIEERAGGKVVSSFGPGMDAVAKITKWNPPHDYITEADEGPEEGPRKVATEWIVEAHDGGRCVVRVVHRWFADSDQWDSEFEGHAYGWASAFFRILRLYLAQFPGQECSSFDLAAFSRSTGPETWGLIKSVLKIDEKTRRFESTSGAPELSGTIESTEITDPEMLRIRERSPQIVAAMEGMDGEEPQLLLRLDRPASGIAHIFIMSMGDQTMLSMRCFLYGKQGAAVAADAKQKWSDWMARQIPQEASE